MNAGLLCVLTAAAAVAQSAGVGLKGGVALSDIFDARGSIGGQPFRAGTERFVAGGMVDVRLPHSLGIEFDFLYKRFEQTAGSVSGGTAEASGSSWEFPLTGKYRFGRNRAAPYIEAGVSFQRLSGYFVPFRTLPQPPADQPSASTTRTGVVAGAGVEVKAGVVRVSPSLRFSHWGERLFVPSTNIVDLLVGVSF